MATISNTIISLFSIQSFRSNKGVIVAAERGMRKRPQAELGKGWHAERAGDCCVML